MKNILSLGLLLTCLVGFSQTPNPNIYQTWYLYDMFSTDDNIHNPVSNVTPAISPQITFTESMEINGIGACNSFFGNYNTPFADVIGFTNFSATLSLCENSQQTSYEGGFFWLLQNDVLQQYTINGEGNNMGLVISTPLFFVYVFGNTPLNTTNFDLNKTILYPNPVETNFYISAPNQTVLKVEIYNSLGKLMKTQNDGSKVVDISDLTSGIYFVKLYSEDANVVKKIVKR